MKSRKLSPPCTRPGALRRALKIRPGEVDFLEIRVDNFAADPAALLRLCPGLRAPLIVTVRHPAEGGAARISPSPSGASSLPASCPYAALIDVELRSFEKLSASIAAARACAA